MIRMIKYIATAILFCLSISITNAQDYRWQQQADYTMEIDFDVSKHQFDGKQEIIYTNNSSDTLNKVYYHLYFNAFQPGSMMDIRARTIVDPDRRVGNRIAGLKPDEQGWHKIHSLTQNGKIVKVKMRETILEVDLAEPILPGTKHVFKMEFQSQVPEQIRRSGRNNKEGIDYSMTQWFPKMAEYDYRGWHAYPYIGREFHGVWGSYDVKIKIDSDYILGGTGYIQNPNEVCHGYEIDDSAVCSKSDKTTWHFKADRVIDFAWAADPDYTHEFIDLPNDLRVHFLYQKNSRTKNTWRKLIDDYTPKMFSYLNKHFGQYPFKQYSFIQGGDGGMEYPMCTLITGERELNSLVGVSVHELAHSWYHMVLATNESLYAWMDEGFTSYATAETENYLFPHLGDQHAYSYRSYTSLVESGLNEPADQHSDHFTTNRAYGTSAYSKGQLLLKQLRYIVGEENLEKGLKRYYNDWKFRHPEPIDFIRTMEKTSGMNLQWFQRYWIETTKTIDYKLRSVKEGKKGVEVKLQRKGEIPMPVEVTVIYKSGGKELYYIPTSQTMGSKPLDKALNRKDLNEWPWVAEDYTFTIKNKLEQIENVIIDAGREMADINRENDSWK